MPFNENSHIIESLIEKLPQDDKKECIVLARPESIPLACEIASTLNTLVDVLAVQPICAMGNRKRCIGAATHDAYILDMQEIEKERLTPDQVTNQRKIYQEHAREAQEFYKKELKSYNCTGKTILFIDTGISTALELSALLASIEKQNPKKIIVLSPCMVESTIDYCESQIDDVIVLETVASYDDLPIVYKQLAITAKPQEIRTLIKKTREERRQQ